MRIVRQIDVFSAVITPLSRFHRMLQRRHPQPINFAGSFSWIIHRDHRVIIAAMRFGKMLSRRVGKKWSNVPGADAEDVGHGLVVVVTV